MRLAILFMPLLFWGCNALDNCRNDTGTGFYYMEIPFTITPHQMVYQVGDTISYRSFIDGQMREWETGDMYTIGENIDFGFNGGIVNISTDSFLPGTFQDGVTLLIDDENKYNLSLVDFRISGGNTLFADYFRQGNVYELDFSFTVDSVGLYYLATGSFLGDESLGNFPEIVDLCDNAILEHRFVATNEGFDPVPILLQSPNPFYNDIVANNLEDAGFLQQGGFAFKVIE